MVQKPIIAFLGCLLWAMSSSAQVSKFFYDFETKDGLPKFIPFQTNYELFENPDQNDINPSLLVGRVAKISDGAIGWSGLAMPNQGPLNVQNGGYFKMKVFAPTKLGTVQVKLETEPLSQQAYSNAEITKLGEWQELRFEYRKGGLPNYSQIVIIFDLGSLDTDAFYFDDLEWVEGLPGTN